MTTATPTAPAAPTVRRRPVPWSRLAWVTLRQRRGAVIGTSILLGAFAVYLLIMAVIQNNAYAGVTLPNPASVRLHESMGFEPVGVYRQVGFKCNAWYDVAWFQKLLQPRPAAPALPTRLAMNSTSA